MCREVGFHLPGVVLGGAQLIVLPDDDLQSLVPLVLCDPGPLHGQAQLLVEVAGALFERLQALLGQVVLVWDLVQLLLELRRLHCGRSAGQVTAASQPGVRGRSGSGGLLSRSS
ncbi:hypothetical protein [Streptomyces sp. RKAG293]|uniref:hypothetical protein n=1 Tax=Streptomyces sp. RKAG293 TaxID=2893403 RepID=UPI0020333279|nr:hypothetical protein [Streptomyces sp. RKAG293]MCM2416683.1 hypothetical protein [Streptomyces sp. RKAG293]